VKLINSFDKIVFAPEYEARACIVPPSIVHICASYFGLAAKNLGIDRGCSYISISTVMVIALKQTKCILFASIFLVYSWT